MPFDARANAMRPPPLRLARVARNLVAVALPGLVAERNPRLRPRPQSLTAAVAELGTRTMSRSASAAVAACLRSTLQYTLHICGPYLVSSRQTAEQDVRRGCQERTHIRSRFTLRSIMYGHINLSRRRGAFYFPARLIPPPLAAGSLHLRELFPINRAPPTHDGASADQSRTPRRRQSSPPTRAFCTRIVSGWSFLHLVPSVLTVAVYSDV